MVDFLLGRLDQIHLAGDHRNLVVAGALGLYLAPIPGAGYLQRIVFFALVLERLSDHVQIVFAPDPWVWLPSTEKW